MPKRKAQDKINHYLTKIKLLEARKLRKRSRIIPIYSDSSDDEDKLSDNEQVEQTDQAVENNNLIQAPVPNEENAEVELDPEPELDPEVLTALGEVTDDTPNFGPKIHEKLAHLWLPLLRKGMDKEAKEKLLKQYLIPANCTLLQAPKLNPEIAAAMSDATRMRDKRVESVQQQLGAGISALNRGLELLLDDDKDRLQAVKFISDSCRLLCDLHVVETTARKKFVTTGLDKSFLNLIQDVDRDEMLFGSKLSEKIKASKVIEKQGLQIKKPAPVVKGTTSSTQASTSRPRNQGNWSGPPRYPSSNRGGRGAYRRIAPAGRGPPPAAQQRFSGHMKSHAQFYRR